MFLFLETVLFYMRVLYESEFCISCVKEAMGTVVNRNFISASFFLIQFLYYLWNSFESPMMNVINVVNIIVGRWD